MTQLTIPEMGSNSEAELIEILVAEGETIKFDQSTLVLESEKSTIEVPANHAGTISKLLVKVGDKFSGGEAYAEIDVASEAAEPSEIAASVEPAEEAIVQATSTAEANVEVSAQVAEPERTITAPVPADRAESGVYAGPAVRLLARELGVTLNEVTGSGLKGRIQKEDVQNFVKQRMQGGVSSGAGIPTVVSIDFSQFGPVHQQALNNIKRATAKAMTIANLNVPQVTQFDEADITALEAFRQQQNQEWASQGMKFSLVPFVMKALAHNLRQFPTFNSSINAQNDGLIMKDYVHIGVAVDTPKGLLVPVIRDVDKKSITQIRQELQDKAELARQGRLSLEEMQGASMSVSSLGGIGGLAFTPIVNPPEVAILGVSKAKMQPVWQDSEFVARLMLPLSLSYDHRVIDGAEAARFSQALVRKLQDLRQLLM